MERKMGFLRWLFDREAYEQEQRDKKLEWRTQKLAFLRTGPVIISTTNTFHKAEFVAQSTSGYVNARGGRTIVRPLCPNEDTKYQPNGSFTTSRRSPHSGNRWVESVAVALDKSNPCKICYQSEIAQRFLDASTAREMVAEGNVSSQKARMNANTF
jgi:hypothetical protein